MTKIWVRMLAIYGHKWSGHLGVAVDDKGKLTESARTWQQGLVGVSLENLKTAFDALVLKNHEWPPSLPEFRKLCLSKIKADVPTLDEVVSILIMAKSRQGSLVSRYKCSLALAVSQSDGLDMLDVRTAKLVDAKRMVKPVYEALLKSGWADWPSGAHDEPGKDQKALGHDKSISRAAGKSFFSEIKAAL